MCAPKNYLYWLLLGICLLGCRDLVQSEFPDFPPAPVVNSILVAGRPVSVHVSLAHKLSKDSLLGEEDAKVLLFVNGHFEEQLQHTGNGCYKGSTMAVPLFAYECRVTVGGFPEAIARDTLPADPIVTDIRHIRNAGVDNEGVIYPAVQFTFQNDVSKHQYYEALIQLENQGDTQLGRILSPTDPILLAEGLPIAVFSNGHIQTDSYTMTINYTTDSQSSSGDGIWTTRLYPFRLELRAVSRNYYLYAKQLYLYEQGRYPQNIIGGVSGAFPLHSNIENGYGIFAGANIYTSETIEP
jgi:hypothetical protein